MRTVVYFIATTPNKYACKTSESFQTLPHVHGLILSVVDHGPALALFAFFLELEVLFKHRGEAVPLEHPCLVDDLVFIGR